MSTFRQILETVAEGSELNAESARRALGMIVRGEVSHEETAAFIYGMRCKGETVGELTAFVEVMREAALAVDADVTGAVDLCGTGGDRSGTFNISTAAMFVVAGAGVPVLKHGNRSVSSNCGSADVLEEMGVAVTLGKRGVEQVFSETGMAFMFAPNFHPAMKHVMPARRALGLRTFFNILGPLLNPAGVRRQVIGAYDRKVAQTMIRILANLGTEQAVTLHAHDGLDEVSISGPTDLFILGGDPEAPEVFDPESLGLEIAPVEELIGGDAGRNAQIIVSILQGSTTDARRDVVLLNAAFGILVSGSTDNRHEALEMARESISSGRAARKWKEFAAASTEAASIGEE